MKLVYYEWKKVISSRAVICLIFCCIAVNAGYHSWQAYKEDGIHAQYSGFRKSDWQEVTAKLQGMEREEQLSWLHQESAWYAYLALLQAERFESAERYWEILQGYPGTDWEARKQEEFPWTREEIEPIDLHKLYNALASRIEYQETYPEFLETVAEQAESMEAMSLFTKIDGYTKRNIEQTAEIYSRLSELTLGFDFSPMTDVGTQSDIADGCLLILVLLIGWQIFFREREEGLYTMLHSAKRGYLPLACAKMLAYFGALLMTCLLLYGSQIIMAGMIYGTGNLKPALQSIPEYRNCAFPVTIGEYLILFVGIKMLAAVIAGCIFMAGAAIGNRFSVSAVVYFAVTAIESYAYREIDSLSAANGFKYVNAAALLDANAWFSEYRNLNVFSYALPAEKAKLAGSAVCLILATVVFAASFCSNRSRGRKAVCSDRSRGRKAVSSNRSRGGKAVCSEAGKRRKAPVIAGGHSRLLMHESYKFFVLGGMLPFLLLLGIAAAKMAVGIPEYTLDRNGEVYRYYIEILAGSYTEETEELLRQEELVLRMEDEEARSMQEAWEAGTVTEKEYNEWYDKRQNFINVRSEGFSRILEQEQAIVRAAQENGWDRVGFADTYQLSYLFRDDTNQVIFAVLLLVSVIFSVSALFGIEERYGMKALIQSTRHGRQDTKTRKLLLSAAGATFAYLVLYVPYYIRIWADIQRVPSDILLSCIPEYEAFPVPLTVGQAFWLMVSIRYITAVECGIITAAAAERAKKTAVGCVIGFLLFAVPCVLFINGVDLSLLTCAGGFLPELMYRNGNVSGYGCLILALTVLSILAGYDVVHFGKQR